MKNYLLAVSFIALFCISCNNKIKLIENKKSDYTIVVSEKADSLTKFAAQEISNYIFKISGVRLETKTNINENGKYILIGNELITDSKTIIELNSLEEDAFFIKKIDENILISGNNAKSNIYATYTFVEEFLGCRLLYVNEEYIPKFSEIILPEKFKIYKPAFSFRRTLFPGIRDEKFRYWHKIEQLYNWGSFVHTFQKLVPPEKYFDEHPEYFSLVGNHRISDGQLCLSNRELMNLLKENLRKKIEKKPEMKYWSVSQNDCYNYCTCTDCEKMYDNYGGISGAYVFMANEIAKEFPDKQISTLAYQFTRSAPTNIKPLENVNIMFCSIECNRSMPLADDKRSSGFVKDMADWAKLTNNIFLWDYVVQFKNYLTPFPNFHVLQSNIQFFDKHNVDLMFQQGSSRNWSDLVELKQYLISKLLWDPYIDADSIINDFLGKYYGEANSYIKSYFDLYHEALIENQENEFLNIYGFPLNYYDSYLSPDLLKKYKNLMDEAEKSVQNDSVYLMRVFRARLPVDFAYLDISLNKNIGELSYFEKSGGEITLREEMMNYLDRFVELTEITGVNRINERNFLVADYYEYTRRKLNMMIKPNKAKGKTINLLTKASEKYPVGKEKSLTDGLFGDLDFHNNWLGFEGSDMIVEIDLQKSEIISQVSMNFLKAVNSWVFLPIEVSVEISKNGTDYKKVGSIKGDIDDRNYLVKSVPFNFDFEAVEAQYLRITAISLKQCPEWHRGFGKPSWIFLDEVLVE